MTTVLSRHPLTTVADYEPPLSGSRIFLSGTIVSAAPKTLNVIRSAETWLDKVDEEIALVRVLASRFAGVPSLKDAAAFLDAPDKLAYDDIDTWDNEVVPVVTSDTEGFFDYHSDAVPEVWRL